MPPIQDQVGEPGYQVARELALEEKLRLAAAHSDPGRTSWLGAAGNSHDSEKL